MKKFYLLVFLGLTTFCRAQSNPEDEIPNFNLDDYFVEPKMSLSVGVRALTGSKVSFAGGGVVKSTRDIGDETATDVIRNYHDGLLAPDERTGSTDGKTNRWAYLFANQVVDNGTNVAFHSYSAQITDAQTRRKDPGLSLGTELIVARDMGKIGEKIEWKLFAGISLNGIESQTRDNLSATITTITDTYGLDGQTAPTTAPYTAPTSVTEVDGSITDTSLLIRLKPDSRVSSATTNSTQVSNFWKLKGTFVTLRMGPTGTYFFNENLKLSISVGPTLVYSGTTYTVEQTLTVDTGDPVNNTLIESEGENLTGYYGDATLQYMLSETAGLYAGAFYQSNGEYTQSVTNGSSTYTTDIDLSQLSGFRAGLNFKF